jgi:PAS domain S-box-containing protein
VDWFVFHQINDEGEQRLLAWDASADVAKMADGAGAWAELLDAAVTSGAPVLAYDHSLRGVLYRSAHERNLTSVAAVRLEVRGQVLGTMILGTAGDRRGLRPGDLPTLQDLASRVAVATERVILSTERQSSAVRAARHALQLQRLTVAAFAVNAALTSSALAAVVASQAMHVLDADGATVDVRGATEKRWVAGATDPGRDVHVAQAALTDASGVVVGAVQVNRGTDPFTSDEEAVLASLAQITSVALLNAQLYEDVQDREARLRAMYDASPVGLVELDGRGGGVTWNRAAAELFGWPGTDEATAGPVELPPAARLLVTQVLERRQSATALDVALGTVDAELVAVPLEGRGTSAGVVLAAMDLTERKQVAERLQLAQRMEATANLAGGIAHDFNNVLMVIAGHADLILRRDLDGDLREDVEAMRAAAARAAELTRKLLTVGRRQVVHLQHVDVAEALESLREVLDVILGEAVDLDLHVDHRSAVLIDPAQLEQLVLNLALNARDAMPRGGLVTIAASASPGGAVLTVADTGEGMDAVTVERCFEPFFTTKDRTKGTGLGLSTVYGVVTQAGGEISVESEVGGGTTFTVFLPAPHPTASVALGGSVATVQPQQGGPLRVLVVDDEPEVRAVVADMLELDGHEVLMAPDSYAALEVLQRFAADVLLTDVVMPGVHGHELARRALEERPDLRVVVMSSHLDQEALEAAVPGAVLLGKPFTPELLADAIATAVAGTASQGSNR